MSLLHASAPPGWAVALAALALWTNTLIIAAEALIRRRWIGTHRWAPRWDGQFGGEAVVAGIVREGAPLARHTVEQRGRLRARKTEIAWHDRSHRSEIAGGIVDTRFGPVRVPPGPGEAWPSSTAQHRVAEHVEPVPAGGRDPADRARRAKGILRQVDVRWVPGDSVYLMGRLQALDDGSWTLAPLSSGPMVLSSEDPAAWARRCRRELVAFATAVVGACALLTAGVAWPPAFGLRSSLFGALGLAFFLLIQPAGVWMRARTIEPAYRNLGGTTRVASRQDPDGDAVTPGSSLH
jgi:hypothetical protein